MFHLQKYFALTLVCVFSIASSSVFAQILPASDLELLPNSFPISIDAYSRIQVASSWKVIHDSGAVLSHVTVGIIDTGIDAKHPEFRGEPNGTSQIGQVNLGSTPLDAQEDKKIGGHGTQVAGIIGANNLASLGVALPVGSPQMNGILSGVLSPTQYELEISTSKSVDGLLFEKAKNIYVQSRVLNAPVVNISFGNTRRSVLTNEQKTNVGGQLGEGFFQVATGFLFQICSSFPNTLFVVAAGNENINVENETPANLGNLPNVLTVGASSLSDTRLPFSSFGYMVGISAPGEQVYAPTIVGKGDVTLDPDRNYAYFSGTSASAPLVTGVAGLIKAIKPNLTPAEIKDILTKTENTDEVITDPDKPIGRRLNALKAVCDARVLGNASPGCVTSTGTGIISGTLRYRPEDGGGAVAGASIYLLTSPTQEFVEQTRTDTNGHYQFTAEAGTYNVVTDQYFIDGTGNCDQGSILVTVSAGQTVVGDITFGFTPGGIVYAVVGNS